MLIEASTGLHAQSNMAWYYVQANDAERNRIMRRPLRPCKGALMAHQHPPRFLKIVDDAKKRVRETNVDAVKTRMDRGDKFMLIDVREESEYAKDHLPGAIHLGKGIIERDIEARVPELNTEMILYCGGGFRSALAADNLQTMGYTNVISMDGGIRGWREKGYPLTKG
ncbi:MAG: rhodanese-like domain-containing protein [Candidatus Sulfotelmatobacter sp.]|jgi:rhodanese-related sulfurtransferase